MPGAWQPPPLERALGLEFYATESPGAGGRLKFDPEDFRVEESSQYPRPVEDGPYTVLRIVARNWEQHELARALAARLGLPPSAMAWAGTKDRRAVSEQLFSYRGDLPPPGFEPPPGVELGEAYRAERGLALGHHFGNRFDVRVSGIPGPSEEAGARWEVAVRALREVGWFPNFFGLQRFGEVRPVTHEVGRALLRGHTEEAVEIYLARVLEGESTEGAAARRAYAEHHDAARALREFPPAYRFERTLLDHLARGHDASRALGALPFELRRLFVHAYQSLLFNRVLSARVARGLPLDRPVPGDRVVRVARDGTVPGRDPIPASADNLEEVRTMVARGRAQLALPLVGTATPELEGVPGELLGAELAREQLHRGDFGLPRVPELASEGTWRPAMVPLPPFELAWEERPPSGGGSGSVRARFALPKGAYATVLFRELLKTGAERRPA
ncbi:MAG TPA: tRNA pseudouridine(13) synthase TruD [Thermoplasmata archaeon]|nr:tRNA pseudouridine(13) synthase TruD [Thermoplasmata archaeon]